MITQFTLICSISLSFLSGAIINNWSRNRRRVVKRQIIEFLRFAKSIPYDEKVKLYVELDEKFSC